MSFRFSVSKYMYFPIIFPNDLRRFFFQPMEYHVLAHRLTFEVEDFFVLGFQSPLETNDVSFIRAISFGSFLFSSLASAILESWSFAWAVCSCSLVNPGRLHGLSVLVAFPLFHHSCTRHHVDCQAFRILWAASSLT